MFRLPLLSIVFFIVFTALSNSVAAERKMGIELEMTNIKFDDTKFKGEDLRHLRLLTVKKSDEEVAYIEVDSDNKDIEFVSQPFSLTNANHSTVGTEKQVEILKACMAAVFETKEKEKIKNEWRVILDEKRSLNG